MNHIERLKALAGIETVNESAPTDKEDFINKHKEDFKQRYGKRWKEVLYATAWKMHNNEVKEEIEHFADHANFVIESNELIRSLSGIDALELNEEEIKKIAFSYKPANTAELKAVEVQDDTLKANDERSGLDELKADKMDVPASVKKAIKTRIAELKASMEEFGGGGPKETAIEQLEKIDDLLSSGNVLDYREAQLLYGKLWNEIAELLPTVLVAFLHTGKELENTSVK